MADEYIIELVADANGVIKAIKKQADKPEVKSIGKQIGDKMGKALNSAMVKYLALSTLKDAGIAAAKAISGGIKDAIAAGYDAAVVQTEAVNKLNASLATTGQFSKQASQELQTFASQLQSATKFGDEAIIKQMAFAQSMGASAEQSKAIASASADMAEALGMDLNQAIRLTSKTLSGYGGELSELLPNLKNLTKEQLQAGEGIGVVSEAFKGFAELSANTLVGRLSQVGNSFGDLLEKIGQTVTENSFLIIALEKIKDALDVLVTNVDFSFLVGMFREMALFSTSALQAIVKLGMAFATLSGNKEVITFMSEFYAFSEKIKQGIQGITEAEIQRRETERQNALERQSELVKEAKQIQMRSWQEQYEEEQKRKRAKKQKEQDAKELAEFNNFKTGLVNTFISGMSSGFQQLGAAMVGAGDGMQDFGSIALGMLGQLAIQTGSFFIAVGAGMTATGAIFGLSGGAAIAAGVALTVLGGALTALSSKGKGTASTSATTSTPVETSPVSSTGGGLALETPDFGTDETTAFTDSSQIEKQASVTVNVQGSIFDADSTGVRIVEILQNEFNLNGSKVEYA